MAQRIIKQNNRKDAVYARQSLDKKDSLSIETQMEKGLALAGDNAEVYQDRGYSGKNIKRPELQRLKADMEADKIQRLIVYRLDRISRNIADFYQLYQLMEIHNVEFISISENFDTSTPMGRAMMGILIVFAQMERESIQERVRDNYYFRIAEDGRWPGGPAPKGFDTARTSDNKPTLVKNRDIEMVKLAFALYAEEANISLAKIARELYQRGYRSSRKNGRFDSVTIARMLQNPVYAVADNLLYKYYKMRKARMASEEAAWDGATSAHIVGKKAGNANIRKYPTLEEQTVYRTNFPGVVPSDRFISVQERLGNNEKLGRANASGKMQELAGLVKCADCGYAIRICHFPNLNCYGRSTLHCCKASIKIKFPALRETVIAEVQKQLDAIAAKLLENHREVKQRDDAIANINREIENLVQLAALGGMGIAQISKAIEERKHKINAIELAQERNLSWTEQAGIGDGVSLAFHTLHEGERKLVIHLLIEKIILHENGDIDICWKI